MNPYIYSIDGIDCVGKTTYCNEIVKKLKEKNKEVKLIHFPRKDSSYGTLANKMLKFTNFTNNDVIDFDLNLQKLCLLDFKLFSKEVKNGVYDSYDFIVMDRSIFSTIAYNVNIEVSLDIFRSITSKDLILPNVSEFICILDEKDKAIVTDRLKNKKQKDVIEKNLNYLLTTNEKFLMINDKDIFKHKANIEVKSVSSLLLEAKDNI